MNIEVTTDYRSAGEFRLGRERVAVVGARLSALARETDGRGLTNRDLLADAEQPGSPLHPLFEWDDAKAGHRFRLLQASALLRAVEVRVVVDDGRERRQEWLPLTIAFARGPVSTVGDAEASPDARGPRHIDVGTILGDEALVARALDVFRDDLAAAVAKVRRWERLSEVSAVAAPVIASIEDFVAARSRSRSGSGSGVGDGGA